MHELPHSSPSQLKYEERASSSSPDSKFLPWPRDWMLSFQVVAEISRAVIGRFVWNGSVVSCHGIGVSVIGGTRAEGVNVEPLTFQPP
jgi:hypothetical protein